MQALMGGVNLGKECFKFRHFFLSFMPGITCHPHAEAAFSRVSLDVNGSDLIIGQQFGNFVGPIEMIDVELYSFSS